MRLLVKKKIHRNVLLIQCIYFYIEVLSFCVSGNGGETSWCFSQVKGTLEDDVTDADLISCVEFNHDGELLATGDKGGRVVIFQVSTFLYRKKHYHFQIRWQYLLCVYLEGSSVEGLCAQTRRIQCVFNFSIARARIRLPEVT